jgi:hypothetical protein
LMVHTYPRSNLHLRLRVSTDMGISTC